MLGLALVLVCLPALFSNSFMFAIAVLALLNASVCVGLNLLVGSAGQVSLGHAAFFGLGAYAVAILPTNYGVPSYLSFILGVIFTGGIAFLIGRPILRLSGHYLAMATLGIGIVIFLILNQEINITGGPDGKPVESLVLFGKTISGDLIWYYISSGFLFLVVWAAYNFMETGYGRSLRALHASEIGAQSVGIDVARAKLNIFVLSACIASAAGSLYAFYVGFITPSEAGFLHSVELIIMVVVGGLGSIFGAIVGAVLITVLPQILTGFHDYEQLAFGLLLMFVAVGLRRGIVPTIAAKLSEIRTQ